MARYNHDLLRMFAPFDVADHVRAFDVRQSLRREHEFHFHRTLFHKIDNQVRVFARDRTGWNLRRITRVFSLTSMRQTKISATDRSNQTRDRALSRRRARSLAPIFNRFTVRLAGVPLRGHLFIERIIEDDDFSRDFVPRHRFQFVEIFYGDHIGGNSFLWRRNTSAQRAEQNFLGRPFRHSRKLNQGRGFFAADPMRHRHFLQLNFAADRFQFARDVLDRFCGLGRAGQSRSDVVGQMRDLSIRVIAAQRRLLQAF